MATRYLVPNVTTAVRAAGIGAVGELVYDTDLQLYFVGTGTRGTWNQVGGAGGSTSIAAINALVGTIGSSTVLLDSARLSGVLPDAVLPTRVTSIPAAPSNGAAAQRYELNVPANTGPATWAISTAGATSLDDLTDVTIAPTTRDFTSVQNPIDADNAAPGDYTTADSTLEIIFQTANARAGFVVGQNLAFTLATTTLANVPNNILFTGTVTISESNINLGERIVMTIDERYRTFFTNGGFTASADGFTIPVATIETWRAWSFTSSDLGVAVFDVNGDLRNQSIADFNNRLNDDQVTFTTNFDPSDTPVSHTFPGVTISFGGQSGTSPDVATLTFANQTDAFSFFAISTARAGNGVTTRAFNVTYGSVTLGFPVGTMIEPGGAADMEILNRSVVTGGLAVSTVPTPFVIAASNTLPVHTTGNLFDLQGTNGIDIDIDPALSRITIDGSAAGGTPPADGVDTSILDFGTATPRPGEILMTSFTAPEIATVDQRTASIGDVLTFNNGGPMWASNTLANLDGVRLGDLTPGQILVEADTHLEALDAFDFTVGTRASYTWDFASTPSSFTLTALALNLDDPAGDTVAVTSLPTPVTVNGATPALRAVQVRDAINTAIAASAANTTWVASVNGNNLVVARLISGVTTEQTQSFTTLPGASIPGHSFSAGTDNTYRLTQNIAPVRQIWQGRNATVTTVTTTAVSQTQNLTFSQDVSIGGLNPTTSLPNGTYRFVMDVSLTATSANAGDARITFVPFIRVGSAAVNVINNDAAGGAYVRPITAQVHGGGTSLERIFTVTTPGAVTAGVVFRGTGTQGTLTFGANQSALIIERLE